MAPLGAVLAWVTLGATLTAAPLPDSVTSMQMRGLPADGEDAANRRSTRSTTNAPADAPLRRKRDALPREPVTHEPHYAFAILETAGFMGLGTLWYWRNAKFNSRDWDLAWDWDSWQQKLTFSAPRFDDNHYDTNALWHPLDGAGIYLVARGNHLSPLASMAVVAASSIIWEYAVEFREYPSVNDMIFTPLTAITVGEPAIRVAALLRSGDSGPIGETVAAVLDPVGAFNGLFERGPPRAAGGTGVGGLPRDYRHRLELGFGMAQASFSEGRTRSELQLGLDLFVDSTPGYGREGRTAGVVGPGALTYLAGGGAVDGGQLSAMNVQGKVALLGGLWRRFDFRVDPNPRGHSLFLGVGSGFDYLERSSPTFSEDRQANVRVLGPMVDWALARGAFNLHVSGDATYDFAQVTPFAGDVFLASADTMTLPTVLKNEHYYFAHGLSLRARAIGTLGRWETGVDVAQDDFRPIGVLDRNDAENAPGTADRRARRRLWLGVRPWPTLPFKATIAGDHVVREGRMGSAEVTGSELRASTSLGLLF